MIMNKITLVLIISTLFTLTTSSLCTIMEDSCLIDRLIDEVSKKVEQGKLDLNKQYLIDARLQRKFDQEVSKVCPKMDQALLVKDLTLSKPLLGEGSFGRVLNVEIDKRRYAMKWIDLNKELLNTIKEGLDASHPRYVPCFNSLDEVVKEEKIFEKVVEIPIKGSENFRKETMYKNDDLFPINIEALNTPECLTINEFQKKIPNKVKNVLLRYRIEIQAIKFLSLLSDQFEDDKRPFMKYYDCSVGVGMNLYLQSPILGPSLFDVRRKCGSIIFPHDLDKRLLLSMHIMYQIVLIHSNDRVHCDLKPENVMFSNEKLTHLHIIDFGFVRTKGFCHGCTPGYAPPEFSQRHSLKPLDEDAFGSPIYQKQDVFSLGMILVELNFDSKNVNIFDKPEKFKESQTKEELIASEKEFNEMLNDLSKKNLEERYNNAMDKEWEYKVDEQFSEIIKQTLIYDYMTRPPSVFVLYVTFQLYKSLKDESKNLIDVKAIFKNIQKLKEDTNNYDWVLELEEAIGIKRKKSII